MEPRPRIRAWGFALSGVEEGFGGGAGGSEVVEEEGLCGVGSDGAAGAGQL
jgi:hypothetical protein